MNAPVNLPSVDDDRLTNEIGLLGILLMGDPTTYRAVAAICGREHFFDPFHARLFRYVGAAVDGGLSAFGVTHWVIGKLRDDNGPEELGMTGSQLVARYIANAWPQIYAEQAARLAKHDSLRVDLNNAVEDGDTGSAETVAAEMERLSRAHLTKDEGIQHIGKAANNVLEAMSKAYAEGGVGRDFAYAGSRELASAIGGWRRGRSYIIAGRPGMGKTTTALSWLLRTAAKGNGVMFFSLEMSKEELTEIALCDLSYSPSSRVEYRDIGADAAATPGFEHRFGTVSKVAPYLNSFPFMISDRAGQSIAEIRSQAQQYAQRLAADGKRLDVICIDHLNLIRSSDRYSGSKTAETEEVSAALKQLAKELQCAVICLCQLNRAVEGRDEKRPNLSDLRWSGAIEQDADVVMFVYREAYYLERTKHDEMAKETERLAKLRQSANRLEVTFGKHRGGPCPVLEFYCDMGCGVVRDLEGRQYG